MKQRYGIDNAQILLGHTTPNTTARYNHRQLQKLKEMASNRNNIFGGIVQDMPPLGKLAKYDKVVLIDSK
jgi:hypothetical protein